MLLRSPLPPLSICILSLSLSLCSGFRLATPPPRYRFNLAIPRHPICHLRYDHLFFSGTWTSNPSGGGGGVSDLPGSQVEPRALDSDAACPPLVWNAVQFSTAQFGGALAWVSRIGPGCAQEVVIFRVM